MNEATDWLSAGAILAAGLILGTMFVYFFARRRPSSAPVVDPALRDLEARRDVLLQQLREELRDDERTRLELETAQVLRSIDEGKARTRTAAPAPQPVVPDGRRSTLIGFAWGAGTMLALGVLGYFVVDAAKPRQDGAAQAMQQQPPPQPSTDPAVLQMEAAVRNRPDDLKLRMDLAEAYLERENLMGVSEQTQYVLGKRPDDPRALTYQALVRVAMGQTAEAATMLERATRVDPALLDAWVALAWVRTQEGKVAEAEAAMQEAMRRRPDEKQRLEQVLAQMKKHQTMDMNSAAAQGQPQQQAPRDGKAITVTIDLDPSAKSRQGVIFVIVRAAGVTAGPPIAVKRLQLDSLPYTFEIGVADSMMGQPLPETVRLDARLDSDGNAATRSPTDPVASQDGVALGSAIRMTLR